MAIPATMALLGLSFSVLRAAAGGLPPLPGFIAKFALLAAVLDPAPIAADGPGAWASRSPHPVGTGDHHRDDPRGHADLLGVTGGAQRAAGARDRDRPDRGCCWPVPGARRQAGPAMRYLQDTAQALHAPPTTSRVLPPAAIEGLPRSSLRSGCCSTGRSPPLHSAPRRRALLGGVLAFRCLQRSPPKAQVRRPAPSPAPWPGAGRDRPLQHRRGPDHPAAWTGERTAPAS